MAIENMTLALDTISKFFGGTGQDGVSINKALIEEVKSQIMANQMMV